MHELKVFESAEFGKLGVLEVDGKPYFPAKKCASILGYMDATSAIKQHCRWVVKHHLPHPQSPDKQIEVNYIPEGDLYRLIARSHLPEAERFERWVFDEVLPSIRKHGGYVADDVLFVETYLPHADENTKQLFRLQLMAQRQANELIKEMKPKADFYDTVTESADAIDMGDAAKVLNMGIGRNKLFALLREKKIIMHDNTPYQRYCDLGYFRMVEKEYPKPDGSVGIGLKTVVHQKGLDFIRKLLSGQPSLRLVAS